MATTYTKLFQSILDSTVWQECPATKVVWVTMLAMSDRDGNVWASVPGLAKRSGVELAECEEALRKFLSPDPYSRTKEHEGRRIMEVDGGWRLLNHSKYREMMNAEERREYQRVKQAEYRAKNAGQNEKPLTVNQIIAKKIKPSVDEDKRNLRKAIKRLKEHGVDVTESCEPIDNVL